MPLMTACEKLHLPGSETQNTFYIRVNNNVHDLKYLKNRLILFLDFLEKKSFQPKLNRRSRVAYFWLS